MFRRLAKTRTFFSIIGPRSDFNFTIVTVHTLTCNTLTLWKEWELKPGVSLNYLKPFSRQNQLAMKGRTREKCQLELVFNSKPMSTLLVKNVAIVARLKFSHSFLFPSLFLHNCQFIGQQFSIGTSFCYCSETKESWIVEQTFTHSRANFYLQP